MARIPVGFGMERIPIGLGRDKIPTGLGRDNIPIVLLSVLLLYSLPKYFCSLKVCYKPRKF